MPIGSVARFDCRRGYGFVIPDDGGEDVFVHQNNINMDGFRYLQPGERVSYELEVGEKGMKAVSVTLLEPRQESENRRSSQNNENKRSNNNRSSRSSGAHAAQYADAGDDKLAREVEKLRRKQERLISLLVEKNILTPGELDGLPAAESAPVEAEPESTLAEAAENI